MRAGSLGAALHKGVEKKSWFLILYWCSDTLRNAKQCTQYQSHFTNLAFSHLCKFSTVPSGHWQQPSFCRHMQSNIGCTYFLPADRVSLMIKFMASSLLSWKNKTANRTEHCTNPLYYCYKQNHENKHTLQSYLSSVSSWTITYMILQRIWQHLNCHCDYCHHHHLHHQESMLHSVSTITVVLITFTHQWRNDVSF